MNNTKIYTFGHSNHSIESFVQIMMVHKIEMIVDVRSAPYSKLYPHFNKDLLEKVLKNKSIGYHFVGDQLGGRSKFKSDFKNGQVMYSKLAEKAEFKLAITQLLDKARNLRISLMCSEKEPIVCHRTILVAQALSELGVDIFHILADSSLESHELALQRILVTHHLDSPDLFNLDSDRIREALEKQERKIAYRNDQMANGWENEI
jgi:uncharacterized protein (DUF488 family)